MLPSLPEIQAAWDAAFPGSSFLLVLLRTAAALADWRARQIQSDFFQLHNDLRLTGLPMHLWHPVTHRTYQLLQRHHTRAQSDFRHALQALQSSYKKPEPVTPPPPPPPPPSKIAFPQTLIVTVENETVTTKMDADAAAICAIPPATLEAIGWFVRHYHFKNLTVPDCYAHLLTHKGVTYHPKLALAVGYPKEDFLRLCRQEIETTSPIPLDDPASRIYYRWSD